MTHPADYDAVRDHREAVVDGMTVPPGGPGDAFWRGAQWAYGQVRAAMDGYVIPPVSTEADE